MKRFLLLLLTFGLVICQPVFAEIENLDNRRFNPDHLSAEDQAACAAFKATPRPREHWSLENIFWRSVFPQTSGGPEGKVSYREPAVLMSRSDLVSLLGEPDIEDENQWIYQATKGSISGQLMIYFDQGFVVWAGCVGTR